MPHNLFNALAEFKPSSGKTGKYYLVKGDGPCNRERLEARRQAHEDGAWVREAAASVGRGARSAIGAYGFIFGGFILEPGKLEDEALSPLELRAAIPDDWRFVLVCPRTAVGDATAGAALSTGAAAAYERTGEACNAGAA